MTLGKNLKKLLEIVGCELITNHSMTTEEILDCIHCGINEDGEIIDLDTGKLTGIWYDEIDYDDYDEE